jgi:hypothetical protein
MGWNLQWGWSCKEFLIYFLFQFFQVVKNNKFSTNKKYAAQ